MQDLEAAIRVGRSSVGGRQHPKDGKTKCTSQESFDGIPKLVVVTQRVAVQWQFIKFVDLYVLKPKSPK